MGKVIASITTSVDGYVTGPDDGPEYGLGRGGERLHYWVMGGPWTYEGGHDFSMHGPDREFFDELVSAALALSDPATQPNVRIRRESRASRRPTRRRNPPQDTRCTGPTAEACGPLA
jgi:hypothetical protein